MRGAQGSPHRKNVNSAGRTNLLKRLLFASIKIGLVVTIIAAIAMSVIIWRARAELPSFEALKSSPNGQMIRIRSRDGQIIQSLGPSFGRWIEYNDIPTDMVNAMIAIEDRRYRSHFGLDPIGIVRSVRERYRRGYWAQGASTITQQLARNIFLNNSRTFGRKFREMILSFAIESKFSKDEILELYLNKVYFGGGAYGIDSASRRFFDHDASTLSLPEAAIIAGLVKAPSRYAPTADAQAAVGRASVVLDAMRQEDMITAAEAASASSAEVKLSQDRSKTSAYYFIDWALPQLDGLIDEREEAIDVWTTVDLSLQAAAQDALRNNAPSGVQGALVSMEDDGAVRALVGGLDYRTSNYNRAVVALRQPGSAWKLFVYLAALEAGFLPDDIVSDEPVRIGNWQPRNSGGGYAGRMTVRDAFALSKNTVAAQIGNELGFGTVASMAKRLGISTPVNRNASMVLGTSETRLIELTRAFAVVGNGGKAVEPYGIERVATIDGRELYQRPALNDQPQLLQDNIVKGMTDLLASAVEVGTGRAAQIGRPVAGKTGTTSANKDGVFVGFSSGLTTGVWYGRDDSKRVGGLQGGRAPAAAFGQFMEKAVADRPVQEFEREMELPDWALEPETDFFDFGLGEEGEGGPVYGEDGMPADRRSPDADSRDVPTHQEIIDRALGGRTPRAGQTPSGETDPKPASQPKPPTAANQNDPNAPARPPRQQQTAP